MDERDVIASGLSYIEDNVRAEITAEELAAAAGYSAWHYARMFARVTGLPVAEYITKRRVELALGEMADGRRAEEAALEYGFDTYAGFYKAVVRIYGCSPRRYLYINRNNPININGGKGKMRENWSNGQLQLNGRVKPPIVVRSDNEMLIAQNCHNLVWEKYRAEYDAIEREIEELKKSEGDRAPAEGRMKALREKGKREIDALIVKEIAAYRSERSGNRSLELEERIEKLEKKLRALESELEDVRAEAEEAKEEAEEAKEIAEEAKEEAEAAKELAEEAKNTAEEAKEAAGDED